MFSTHQHLPDAASPSGSSVLNGKDTASQASAFKVCNNGHATPAPEQTPQLIKAIGGVATTQVSCSVSCCDGNHLNDTKQTCIELRCKLAGDAPALNTGGHVLPASKEAQAGCRHPDGRPAAHPPDGRAATRAIPTAHAATVWLPCAPGTTPTAIRLCRQARGTCAHPHSQRTPTTPSCTACSAHPRLLPPTQRPKCRAARPPPTWRRLPRGTAHDHHRHRHAQAPGLQARHAHPCLPGSV